MRKATFFLLAFLAPLAAPPASAQAFGVGASVGLVNDLSRDAEFDGFHRSEVAAWFEYEAQENVLVRFTYGSMRNRQTFSGATVETPEGPVTLPEFKERIQYGTVGVSYLLWEGYFTSGLFAGVGAYGIRPDTVPPDLAPYSDLDETVFGFHGGVDGAFRLYKNLSLVIRLTYHNLSAHPHRQFINADGGLVVRF